MAAYGMIADIALMTFYTGSYRVVVQLGDVSMTNRAMLLFFKVMGID